VRCDEGFGALFFFISLWPPHQPHRLMKIEERKRMGVRLVTIGWMIAVQDGVV
jgi:hypothetical protein